MSTHVNVVSSQILIISALSKHIQIYLQTQNLNIAIVMTTIFYSSYEEKLFAKDEVIEELEDKIAQLEARLRALGGAPTHDTTAEGSVTLELAGGSRPPSSLHSVPQERASSRVVSLNGTGPHDKYV